MARWMDPNTGTFLSVDPVVPAYDDPQSLNAYAYARNNPITLDDPTGMCPSECWYGKVPDGVPVPGHAVVGDPGYLADYGVVSGQLAGSIGSDLSGGLSDFFTTGAEGEAGPAGDVGFFQGVGQRFSNLATYGQFSTDAQVATYIEGAATAYLLGGEQGLAQFVRENGFATGTGVRQDGTFLDSVSLTPAQFAALEAVAKKEDPSIGDLMSPLLKDVELGMGPNTREFMASGTNVDGLARAAAALEREQPEFGRYTRVGTALMPGGGDKPVDDGTAEDGFVRGPEGVIGRNTARFYGANGIAIRLGASMDNSAPSRGHFVEQALNISYANGGIPVFVIAPKGAPGTALAVEFTGTARSPAGRVAPIRY